MANDTFVRITNQHIYDKLCEIEKHVEQTNGKVKLNKWIGTTALSLVIIVLGFIITYALKS